jgi:hypothetical protein
LADLTLILAGPIIRRVEPTLVCIWVALSQPKSIRLTVFEGRQVAGIGPDIFIGGNPLTFGATNTLPLGTNLHIGVVYAQQLPEQALTPGLNYSYNLSFGPVVANQKPGSNFFPSLVVPTADLKTEGLLANQPINGHPNLPLGYDIGELPGFAMPPAQLTDLRLLHGSCRRPGHKYESGQGKNSFDGMAWIDDLIINWRTGASGSLPFDANVRPHQLFLTGDQIYADDVATPLLPMLNRVGNQVIGKTELLPTRYPPDDTPPAKKETFLNAPKQPGFATIDAFIAKMKADGKKPLEELKKDRRVRVLNDPCFDRQFILLYEQAFTREPGFQTDPAAPEGVRFWPADLRHFPAGLRRPVMDCEAKFSGSNHLMSLGEYCAMYLAVWCNAVWEMQGDDPALPTVEQIYTLPSGDLPQIWDYHACDPDKKVVHPRKDRAAVDKFLQDEKRGKASVIQGVKDDNDTLGVFFASLARVRRALANIPTYMVFDDHDITDDWNLSRAWRDRVFTSPLGRRILTSSLVAYALFQDWGNDPKRYEKGAYRSLLDEAINLFPASASSGPAIPAMTKLEKLFALNQPNPEPAPELKWHFSIDGPRHRVVVLDTRTRRVYRSRNLPPGLLSPEALKEQLPDPSEKPLPAGIDILIVISQTPPLLPSLATSVILPLLTAKYEFKKSEELANLAGTEPDNEIWPGDETAFKSFLERLAQYKRAVVLSGEVHYGYTAQLSLWKKGIPRLTLPASLESALNSGPLTLTVVAAFQTAGVALDVTSRLSVREGNNEWVIVDSVNKKTYFIRKETTGLNVFEENGPARVANFVSSGIKNAKDLIVTLGRGLGFAFSLIDLTPAERMIWEASNPPPLVVPPEIRLSPPVRDRMGSLPVILPSGNWPPGVTSVRQPDTAWRIDLVRDERPDSERADFTRPAGPAPEFDTADINGSYRKIAARHAAQIGKLRFSRGVVYQANLGLVRFEFEGENLVACHDLYSHPPNKHQAALINVYRVPLSLFEDERPRLKYDLPVES